VLALVLVVFVLVGAFEEGFDRLWEAHLLLDVGLPELGALGVVGWFGVLGAATLVLAFAVAAPAVRRVERLEAGRLTRLLLVLHGALLAAALGFALAGSVWLAVAAYLATAVVRDLTGPTLQTWLNESITDSSVRATVLSITSVAGSLGEWTGGPALGLVGNRWGVRTALAAGALLLAPTLLVLTRAARHQRALPAGGNGEALTP
jgi:predicted MFS family arabinose efflux permease